MNWLRRLVARRRLYADLSEEIRQHLDEKIGDLVDRGMSRADAAAAAHREFGNLASLEERSRDVWRWTAVEDFLCDARYALRQLRRHPSFTLVAVLTLALALGANTAVFSIVNAVLLRPLPFPDSDRLVAISSLNTQRAPRPGLLSYPNFFDLRAANRVFERIVSYRDSSFTLTRADRAIHVQGQIVSWDLFPLLGVEPALGRGFRPDEERAGSRAVVISYGLWQELFGADRDIVGRSITLNGEPYTVVGVAPPGFRFPAESESVRLWTTVAVDAAASAQRGSRMLGAIGRLKAEVTIEEAGAHMDALAGALAKQYPENVRHARMYLRPELERVVGPAREPLLVLMGAVALVLLIACANIAGLLLARTTEREREFAVRSSIGASRRRVIRQLLTEGFVLAALGGLAGVLAASATLRLLPAVLAAGVPRIQQVGLDRSVLLFAGAVTLFTCILFSIAPALQMAKAGLVGQLKDGARGIAPGRQRLRGALVVGQIALSLALVSAAALLVASLINALQRDPGFDAEHVLKFSVSLPEAQYDEPRRIGFYDRLFDRLSGVPGAQSVAGGGPLPLTGNRMTIAFSVPGRPTSRADRPRANVAIVTPAYFRTLGIPLVHGRDFTQRDDAQSPPVVIVNQAFADRFFPDEDAVGRSMEPGIGPQSSIRRIVGIVGNAQQLPLSAAATPIYYVPFRQVPWFVENVVMRTAAPPATFAATVRAAVASIDKQAAVHDLAPLRELQAATTAIPGFLALLLGSFAGMALLLAAVGLYGVVSHSVGRRTNEIGVRMALGATRASVLGMVLRQAMVLVGIGLAIGFAAALAGAGFLATLLYGVEPHDPVLLALACGAITVAGIVAAYLPAHRAASIEPVRALRAE